MVNLASTSPAWGIACLVAGCATAYSLRKIPHTDCFHTGRHQNMDGLRGVLALIMFICHAASWQQYLTEKQWRTSDSPFYILPGQTGIVIFFMLTGFLFARKFLTSKNRTENWIRLYTSRVLRLVPAYALMLSVLLLVIIFQTLKGHANWADCKMMDIISWAAFTIPGAPSLCGYNATIVAVAGVTWSLTYEWTFYSSLPFLAVLARKRVALPILILSGLACIILIRTIPIYTFVYFCFILGITSAFLDFHKPSQWLRNSPWAGLLAIALLITNSLIHNETSYKVSSALIIGMAFHIFSSGNSLYGMLTTRTFQVFGLCTYSLYLFHGLLLYTTLNYLNAEAPLFHLKNHIYWPTIIFLTPILITISLFIYLKVEHPPMQKLAMTSEITQRIWLRWQRCLLKNSYFSKK